MTCLRFTLAKSVVLSATLSNKLRAASELSKSWMPTILGQKAALQAKKRLQVLPSRGSGCHHARERSLGTCRIDCSSQDM